MALSIFVPEVSRGLVEGPGGATLEALSRLAHEVALRGWGGSAEVLLFSPPTLGETDGAAPVDHEVLRVQRRQAVPELVAMMLQDWLELLADDEDDVRLLWRFDEGGHLEISASLSDPDERVLLEPTGSIFRALGCVADRLGEAHGVKARLALGRPGW